MHAPVKIVTFSAKDFGATQEEILATFEKKLEELRTSTMDLLCFPEQLAVGEDRQNPNTVENNRRALELAKKYSAELHTNMVISLTEEAEDYPGHHYNTAYLLGRDGNIIGKCRKRHLTFGEMSRDSLPGESTQVFETDIGRIGLATCYDAGWRADWAKLAENGAQIVVWPSAYHGGNLLNGYAAVHMYYVVTSVRHMESRIIDRMGNTIAEGNRWDQMVSAEIYPQSEIFHTDRHVQLIGELRKEYGDKLYINVDGKINMIEIASRDPDLSLEEIKAKYGMQSYKDYHAAADAANKALLEQYPEK